jgi:2'-5' RNA ligase
MQLADRIENEMETFSFPKEKRAFTPHLTLGRVRSDQKTKISSQTMKEIVQKEGSTDFGSFEANQVLLVKSELTPKGPVYSNLATIQLKERLSS